MNNVQSQATQQIKFDDYLQFDVNGLNPRQLRDLGIGDEDIQGILEDTKRNDPNYLHVTHENFEMIKGFISENLQETGGDNTVSVEQEMAKRLNFRFSWTLLSENRALSKALEYDSGLKQMNIGDDLVVPLTPSNINVLISEEKINNPDLESDLEDLRNSLRKQNAIPDKGKYYYYIPDELLHQIPVSVDKPVESWHRDYYAFDRETFQELSKNPQFRPYLDHMNKKSVVICDLSNFTKEEKKALDLDQVTDLEKEKELQFDEDKELAQRIKSHTPLEGSGKVVGKNILILDKHNIFNGNLNNLKWKIAQQEQRLQDQRQAQRNVGQQTHQRSLQQTPYPRQNKRRQSPQQKPVDRWSVDSNEILSDSSSSRSSIAASVRSNIRMETPLAKQQNAQTKMKRRVEEYQDNYDSLSPHDRLYLDVGHLSDKDAEKLGLSKIHNGKRRHEIPLYELVGKKKGEELTKEDIAKLHEDYKDIDPEWFNPTSNGSQIWYKSGSEGNFQLVPLKNEELFDAYKKELGPIFDDVIEAGQESGKSSPLLSNATSNSKVTNGQESTDAVLANGSSSPAAVSLDSQIMPKIVLLSSRSVGSQRTQREILTMADYLENKQSGDGTKFLKKLISPSEPGTVRADKFKGENIETVRQAFTEMGGDLTQIPNTGKRWYEKMLLWPGKLPIIRGLVRLFDRILFGYREMVIQKANQVNGRDRKVPSSQQNDAAYQFEKGLDEKMQALKTEITATKKLLNNSKISGEDRDALQAIEVKKVADYKVLAAIHSAIQVEKYNDLDYTQGSRGSRKALLYDINNVINMADDLLKNKIDKGTYNNDPSLKSNLEQRTKVLLDDIRQNKNFDMVVTGDPQTLLQEKKRSEHEERFPHRIRKQISRSVSRASKHVGANNRTSSVSSISSNSSGATRYHQVTNRQQRSTSVSSVA